MFVCICVFVVVCMFMYMNLMCMKTVALYDRVYVILYRNVNYYLIYFQIRMCMIKYLFICVTEYTNFWSVCTCVNMHVLENPCL